MKSETPPNLKRSKPSYLSYAADWIADETYMVASAGERGLLFSLLNYCWVNGSIPADPHLMAIFLRLSDDETRAVGSKLITKHFRPLTSDPNRLGCPELARQHAEDAEYHRKVSEGGRKGGIRTQSNHRELQSSQASSLAKAPEMRRDEMRRDASSKKEQSSPQSKPDNSILPPEHRKWVSGYEQEEQAQAPLKASRG